MDLTQIIDRNVDEFETEADTEWAPFFRDVFPQLTNEREIINACGDKA